MAMTLGHQSNMYNIFATHQQHTPSPGNCVIVSGSQPHLTNTKSVIQGKRPLAPAPERSSVLVNSNGDHLRCKRKIQFIPHVGAPQQPASVARRNARERNRVKQVNNGFATLRQHIPETVCATLSPQGGAAGRGANKKLSKVDTLRMAVEYIRSLQRTIEDHDMELASNAGSDNNHADNSSYYSMSPNGMNNSQFSYPILLPTPSCSEASTSPTPSQTSESFTNHSVHSFNNSQDYANENYDPNNADDEELLDVIFSWQNE